MKIKREPEGLAYTLIWCVIGAVWIIKGAVDWHHGVSSPSEQGLDTICIGTLLALHYVERYLQRRNDT